MHRPYSILLFISINSNPWPNINNYFLIHLFFNTLYTAHFLMISSKCYSLPATNYQPPTTSYKLSPISYKVPEAQRRGSTTSYQPPATSFHLSPFS